MAGLAAVLLLAGCAGRAGLPGVGTTRPRGAASGPASSVPGPQVGKVVAVIDGDTIKVALGGTIARTRLLGLNAPEVRHVRYGKPRGQCGGQSARRFADRLLYGKTVTLTADPREDARDRYGRLLRYVSVDGRDAGLAIIRAGHASEYHPASARRETRYGQYVRAEDSARAHRRGQWATCRPDQVTKAPAG